MKKETMLVQKEIWGAETMAQGLRESVARWLTIIHQLRFYGPDARFWLSKADRHTCTHKHT